MLHYNVLTVFAIEPVSGWSRVYHAVLERAKATHDRFGAADRFNLSILPAEKFFFFLLTRANFRVDYHVQKNAFLIQTFIIALSFVKN